MIVCLGYARLAGPLVAEGVERGAAVDFQTAGVLQVEVAGEHDEAEEAAERMSAEEVEAA